MLSLILANLPKTLAGPNDPAYRGMVPTRARFLHPDACSSVLSVERDGGLVYTDIFRGAEGQRLAKLRNPKTTKAVSLSGHGYGFSFDVDVSATLKRRGCTYDRLLDFLAERGWHCHRRDRKRGSEDWHFNFVPASLLQVADRTRPSTWDDVVEKQIQRVYGAQLAPGDVEVQALLDKQGLDPRAFQTYWGLVPDGIVGPATRRVLAYVTAELDVRGLFA